MKYIRTKDGIYEYTSPSEAFDGVYTTTMGVNHLILYKEIIKQADTIEELCDKFVLVDTESGYCDILPKDKEIKFDKVNMGNAYDRKFYGAIWTDKGLIYVAKMNEKGELELLCYGNLH